MSCFHSTLAAALLCCAGSAAALAAPAAPTSSHDAISTAATAGDAVRLPDSREWTMRGSANGREYRIMVALPEGPAPEAGYATIYILDGDAMFLTTVEAVRAYARRRDPERDLRAIVVGIGYPDGVDTASARAFDLTPDVPEPRIRHATGGADAFLDFVVDELKPRIAREFPVDPHRQALMGHSFGGLFTINALTRRPDAFDTWVGMSTSFWFGDHALSRRVADFAQAREAGAAPARVLLLSGEFEQTPKPDDWARDPERAAKTARDLEWRGQSTRARAAAEALADAPGLLVDVHEIPAEDHGTVIPAAIARGIDFFFTGPTAVPPVPTAAEYQQLGPEGRYRLRMQVRALPELHRIPWLNGLKASLHGGLDADAMARLHEERQMMDQRHGSRPHERNAD